MEEKISRCFCNACSQVTTHLVRDQCVVEGEDEEDGETQPYWWRETFEFLQCRGCGQVCLRKQYEDAAMDNGTVQFPPRIARRMPKWRWNLPSELSQMLGEIYVAMQNDCPRLGLMGARTLMDILLNQHVGNRGTFAQRLEALKEKGVISEANREILETALDAGHAAAHRGFRPTPEELNAVMDITENILQSAHHLPEVAKGLRKRIPPRPK